VKALTASSWQVSWSIGAQQLTAKHQVRWLLNTNNCSVVLGFLAAPPLLDGAAVVPDGPPGDAVAPDVEDDEESSATESDNDGEPEEAAPIDLPGPPADLLCPLGLQWMRAEQPLVFDARTAADFEPLMRWKSGQSSLPHRSPVVYFKHFLPPIWSAKICEWTSIELRKQKHRELLPPEVDKWLGILLSCTFVGGFTIRDMWSTKDEGFFPPPAIGSWSSG
jgi:hypothetical protein